MPSYRAIALSLLNEKNPGMASNLRLTKQKHPRTGKETTALDVYLENRERHAREALKGLTKRLMSQGIPENQAETMADEMVIEQVLNPTT